MLETALKARCPVGTTHRLYNSIHRSKVGVGPHYVGGSVLVSARHTYFVEFKTHPFVRMTRAIDGPKALRAMARVIKEQT